MSPPSVHSFLIPLAVIARDLLEKLKGCPVNSELVLDALPSLQKLFKEYPHIRSFVAHNAIEKRIAFKSFAALNPNPSLFQSENERDWQAFIEYLTALDRFYKSIGGIIGYYALVLELLVAQDDVASMSLKQLQIHQPPYLNLVQEKVLTQKSILEGIQALNSIAFMAPVGGAGERLDLHDPRTAEALPVAALPFLGRSLLEELIRDIQALELLYRKVMGASIEIPIALMTSTEKDNDHRIKEICRSHNWFGRSPENFRFFSQPQVPLIDERGRWVIQSPLKLMTRPGGHGALWCLAEESGTLTWLEAKGKKYVLIRQINNPIAGSDNTILALLGYGIKNKKAFGFIGCNQLPHAHEGIDLLLEKKRSQNRAYHITNVEYSDFVKWGLSAISKASEASYPANTNILFTSIAAIREGIKATPIPAPLVNFKTKVSGETDSQILFAGRLETTMQNLADAFEDVFPLDHPVPTRDELRTFIVYNERKKTISVTKRQWKGEESILETPEGAFFDLLANNHYLLESCKMQLPPFNSAFHYLEKGPNSLFLFHPALGPLYDLIRQKIKGGDFAAFSELILELSDLMCENLSLQGSFIVSDLALSRGSLQPAFCQLKNVCIKNEGIDFTLPNCFWKGDIHRKERLKVILHENSEFVAQDVIFIGNQTFEVLPGERLEVYSSPQGELLFSRTHKERTCEQSYVLKCEEICL